MSVHVRLCPPMSIYVHLCPVLSCPVQSFLDSMKQADIDGRDTPLYDIMTTMFFIVAVSPVHFKVTNQTAYDNFTGLFTLGTRSFRYIIY